MTTVRHSINFCLSGFYLCRFGWQCLWKLYICYCLANQNTRQLIPQSPFRILFHACRSGLFQSHTLMTDCIKPIVYLKPCACILLFFSCAFEFTIQNLTQDLIYHPCTQSHLLLSSQRCCGDNMIMTHLHL